MLKPRKDWETTVHHYRDYHVGYNYFLPWMMYPEEFAILFKWSMEHPGKTPIIKYDVPWRKEWRPMIPKRRMPQ